MVNTSVEQVNKWVYPNVFKHHTGQEAGPPCTKTEDVGSHGCSQPSHATSKEVLQLQGTHEVFHIGKLLPLDTHLRFVCVNVRCLTCPVLSTIMPLTAATPRKVSSHNICSHCPIPLSSRGMGRRHEYIILKASALGRHTREHKRGTRRLLIRAHDNANKAHRI
jgi:hypothetical protein